MIEQWRTVKGYEGIYEVSDEGRIRAVSRRIVLPNGHVRNLRERYLIPRVGAGGAFVTHLTKNNSITLHRVVDLIDEAFEAT